MTSKWSDIDLVHMREALLLAKRQLGRTGINPAVGCVIVNQAEVVGRGATADGGRPHSEAVAIAQAGTLARGATAYVTLEPCAHQSERGGNCADALIAADIARLVCCVQDPDARTGGEGFERLRKAGILVEVGLLSDEGRVQIAAFAIQFES